MSEKTYQEYYDEMDSYSACMIAEGAEESESEEQIHAAWQYLVDTDLCWQLQGWFGRTAVNLIQQGLIEATTEKAKFYSECH